MCRIRIWDITGYSYLSDSFMIVTMLGTRGSVPVHDDKFREFGGATTCVRVIAGDEEIYLDAGTGIVGVRPKEHSHLSILLTHPHLDHLIGLPFFPGLSEKGRRLDIYMKETDGRGVKEALNCLYTPPLWPLGVFDYPAEVRTPEMPHDFNIGEVRVNTMEGDHPGGVTIFRLSYKAASVVFATDYEHSEAKDKELAAFSKDCSLLIYDGQYMDEDFESFRGFGHSTPAVGIEIARKADAKALLITHHDPRHTDRMLLEAEARAKKLDERVRFARCGEELILGEDEEAV